MRQAKFSVRLLVYLYIGNNNEYVLYKKKKRNEGETFKWFSFREIVDFECTIQAAPAKL